MNRFCVFILSIVLPVVTFASGYVFNAHKGIIFSWSQNDPIVVFPDGGGRIQFWALNANGNNSSFSAYGWGLTPNYAFTAYSPFDSRSGSSANTALPMTYAGQEQTANNSLLHLSAYDYMLTPRTMSTETELNLTFSHLGSVIRFEIMMHREQMLTSLTLNAQEPIVLTLDNIKVNPGGTLVAYMMVPPMTLTNGRILITLQNDEGQQAEIPIQGSEIVAGKCYPVALVCSEFVDVNKSKSVVTKSNTPTVVAPTHGAKTTAAGAPILYPTAYAPDFLIDAEHPLQQADSGVLGDVNGDGEVMLDDAVLLINHVLRRTTSELNKNVADANRDGDVDIADAVAIVNIYLKR